MVSGIYTLEMAAKIAIAIQREASIHRVIHLMDNVIANQELSAQNVINVQ